MADSNDKDLGMDRGINRRDFLNGVAVTAGASLLPPHVIAALANGKDPEKAADYYPPILTAFAAAMWVPLKLLILSAMAAFGRRPQPLSRPERSLIS